MNDRKRAGPLPTPDQKVGSDRRTPATTRGTCLDGNDDEAPCLGFRPRSQIVLRERHTVAKQSP